MNKSIDGSVIQGALLQLDVVDSSKFLVKQPDSGKEIFSQLHSFITNRIAHLYFGKEILWPGDGGIYLFCEQSAPLSPSVYALLSAIEINRSMALFNNLISPYPCHLETRLSIDFLSFKFHDNTSKINDPRFSWFLKKERNIAKSNSIYLTEDVFSHIEMFQLYCSKSHLVDMPMPSGSIIPLQIYYFDVEKSLGSDRLFDILHQINKSDQSIYPYLEKHVQQVLTTLEKLSNKGRWKDLLALREYLHRFFELSGQYHEGIAAGRLFLKAAEELDDKISQCWISIKDIGGLTLQLGKDIDGARQIINNTISKFEELKCWEGVYYCNRFLGVSHYWNDNFSEAERLLKKAETYIPKCNSEIRPRLTSRLKNNFGQYYLQLAKPRKAIPYFRYSLIEFKRINDIEKIAVVEINFGRAYSMQKKYVLAKKFLNDAINHAWEINWFEGIGRAKYELAEILFQDKLTFHDAETLLREAASIFRKIGVVEWIGKTETLASMMYKKK